MPGIGDAKKTYVNWVNRGSINSIPQSILELTHHGRSRSPYGLRAPKQNRLYAFCKESRIIDASGYLWAVYTKQSLQQSIDATGCVDDRAVYTDMQLSARPVAPSIGL